MTQPTINFEDGTFPDAEVSEIDRLTAAVRDLAAAIRDLAAGDRGSTVERAPADLNIERILPDTRESEEFWRDFSVRDLHDALVGPVNEPVGVPVGTLEDVPEGREAVLGRPRLLPKEIAREADIYVDREVWVRKVQRESVDDEYAWSFWEEGEADDDAPWGAHTKQIEALGLTYEDFSPMQS